MVYEKMFLEILKKEMVPALGCTDPIGVAYAAACAKKYATGEIVSITGFISVNVIKNASAVCMPKTGGKFGVGLALALGAIGGNAEKGLEVLSDVTEEDVVKAEELMSRGVVQVNVSENQKKLYIQVVLQTDQDEIIMTIEDNYTRITSITVNGEKSDVSRLEEEQNQDEEAGGNRIIL